MKLNVTGVSSLNHRNWIAIERMGLKAHISPQDCSSPQKLKGALAEAGIVIASKKDSDALLEAIDAIPDYLPAQLADGLGWNGLCYQLPSGEVISPPNLECESVFAPSQGKDLPSDNLKTWQQDVVIHLADNPLGLLALALPFVGPLLKLISFERIPAFEIVSGGGTGKSTLQHVSLNAALGKPVIPFACSLAAHGDAAKTPNQHAAGAKDSVLILDSGDREMITQKPDQRRALYRGIEKLASGDAGKHFVLLSTSREPLGDLLGNEAPRALAYQRVLTINLGKDRPHGVFDHVPDHFSSASAFADHLRLQSSKYRGLPLRHYLERLVADHAKGPEKLAARIGKSMKTFREKAGSDDNNGEERWRVDCFAIVYAAAMLAKRYGAFPANESFAGKATYGKAILACYDLHRGILPSLQPFEERLVEVARAPDTIIATNTEKRNRLDEDTINEAKAFVTFRKGAYQLLVRSEAIDEVFYDWKMIQGRPQVKEHLDNEKRRNMNKREIAGVKLGRVFAFHLPQDWKDGESIFN